MTRCGDCDWCRRLREVDPVERLAGRGERAETTLHARHRDRLLDAALDGDLDAAWLARTAIEATGDAIDGDDHLLMLIAWYRSGHTEDAEAYLRTIPSHMLAPAHLHATLAAHAFGGRARDAERLYEEFDQGPVAPDDRCRVTLLAGFGLLHDHERARHWYERFAPQLSGGMRTRAIAWLIRAHAHPDALDHLARVDEALSDDELADPEVAAELVRSYAAAGDPANAEWHLRTALRLVRSSGLRSVLIDACVRAHASTDNPPGVGRILALAAMEPVCAETQAAADRGD